MTDKPQSVLPIAGWAILAAIAGIGISYRAEIGEAILADVHETRAKVAAELKATNARFKEERAKEEAARQAIEAQQPWGYDGYPVHGCQAAIEAGYQIAKDPGGWQKRGKLFRYYAGNQMAGWCAYKQNY